MDKNRLITHLRDLDKLIPNKVMNTILRDILEYVLDIDINKLEETVNEYDYDIKTLYSKVDDNKDNIKTMDRRIGSMLEDIDELNIPDVTDIENRINNLEDEVYKP